MNTKKLIEHALEKTEMWPLHEGPRTGEESLMIAQLELLAVIAQELKRANDNRIKELAGNYEGME
jgi:hypothetical protein